MSEAFLELGLRSPPGKGKGRGEETKGTGTEGKGDGEKNGKGDLRGNLRARPKLITLGGDHSLALPALRALKKVYGREVRVVHFDG